MGAPFLFRKPPPAPNVALPKAPEPTWFDKTLAIIQGATGLPLTDPENYEQGGEQLDRYAAGGELASMLAGPLVAMSVLGKGANRIANPIKAYHGSPHDFDAFDASKIGTGEGAQAYGHGLYFAENEAVAKGYREGLAGKPTDKRVMIDDRGLYEPNGFYATTDDQRLKNGLTELHSRFSYKKPGKQSIAEVREDLTRTVENYKRTAARGETMSGDVRQDKWRLTEAEDALYALDKVGERLDIAPPHQPGKTYEVNLHASPDELLDWDQPLSAQPPKVREAVKAIRLERNPATARGEHIYRAAERTGPMGLRDTMPRGERTPEHVLQKFGIKGIQYLDQGSRGRTGGTLVGVTKTPDGWQARVKVENRGGTDMFTTSKPYASEAEARAWADKAINTGTKNYVIFPGHEDLIEIAKKYGIPLATVQAAYAAYQRDQQKVPLSTLGGQE